MFLKKILTVSVLELNLFLVSIFLKFLFHKLSQNYNVVCSVKVELLAVLGELQCNHTRQTSLPLHTGQWLLVAYTATTHLGSPNEILLVWKLNLCYNRIMTETNSLSKLDLYIKKKTSLKNYADILIIVKIDLY